MKLKIKKGDTVQVIAGADKGKKGAVLNIDSRRLKIQVQGAKLQTHFTQEGLQQKEAFMDYSNVKLVTSGAKKVTKKNPRTSKLYRLCETHRAKIDKIKKGKAKKKKR